MLKLDDLWIGDKVLLKKSGRVGTFEGVKNGKVRVKCADKIVVTPVVNLDIYIEKEVTPDFSLDVEIYPKPSRPDPVIDLHIENLNPWLKNNRPERIIDYQIAAARNYIDLIIEFNMLRAEIIHGKGEGILKSEVHHLLSMRSEVKHFVLMNDGGSTEILL